MQNFDYPTLFVVQPKNFIPEISIKNYNQRWHEKYIWFIHCIVYKQITTKDKFNNYINLSSHLLQKFLGSRYFKKIKTALIESKVIEYNKSYSANGFSQSYRLTKRYQDEDVVKRTIEKATYCKKIYLYNKDYLNNLLKEDDTLRKEFLELTHWAIKSKEAYKYLELNPNGLTNNQIVARQLQISEVEKLSKTTTKDNIIDAEFTFKKDRAGRIHTPLTNLAKDLRTFLYHIIEDDTEYCYRDVVNSQIAFFCGKHLKDNCHIIGSNSTTSIRLKKKEEGKHFAALSGQINTTPYHMTIREEFVKFKKMVFRGDFYEQLMKAVSYEYSRDDFKEYFFKELWFNSNRKGKTIRVKKTQMELVFMKSFPNVFNVLWTIKSKIGNSEFCIGLQREESVFMHRNLVNSLPVGMPFFIVHDAIYTTIENQFIIEDILDSLALNHFGEPISFKTSLV